MSEDKEPLPDKKEERGLLARVLNLVPLLSLILQILEFVLEVWRMIR